MKLFQSRKGEIPIALILVALLVFVLFKGGSSVGSATQAAAPAPAPAGTTPPISGTLITNLGDSATINPNFFLVGNRTQPEVGIEVRGYRVSDAFGNADTDGTRVGPINANSDTILAAIGETYDFYCGNSTDLAGTAVAGIYNYYCFPKLKYKIASANPVVRLEGFGVQQEAAMNVQVWDPSTSANATGSSNVTSQDYNITMGASQSKRIEIRLRNLEDNGVFRVAAICYGFSGANLAAFEDLSEGVPQEWQSNHNGQIFEKPSGGVSWTTRVAPVNVTSTVVDAFTNSPRYKECYVRPTPLIIPKFSQLSLYGTIRATSTDPVASVANTASDGLFFNFVDSAYTVCAKITDKCTHVTDTKDMVDSFYTQDQVEDTTPGLNEYLASPVGQTIGAVIGTS